LSHCAYVNYPVLDSRRLCGEITTKESILSVEMDLLKALNSNKKELTDAMYNLVFNDQETPWYINCAIAQTDEQRFKVPISGSGILKLIKYS
jgi:hypothetical protein